MRAVPVTALLVAAAASGAGAQHSGGTMTDSIRPDGIIRASRVVDSVFVDRTLPHGFVFGGDWGAYLMARLGAVPIPDDLKIAVDTDTRRIVLHTRVGDLPLIARQALGPMLGFLPPQTVVEGEIGLDKLGPQVVRFRLTAVRLNGMTVPEPFLQAVMTGVGRDYPKLTKTGRDLLIQIPRDAEVLLAPGGVQLIGPAAESAPGGSVGG
ncbi:MAG TPA: hypothetical protein VGA25_07710 [Burkholderiales bacterium]|jgi:hypothetical protein